MNSTRALGLFIGFALVATSLLAPGTVALSAAQNPVVAENQQPGTSAWQIRTPSSDSGGQIQAYAGATSVNAGSAIPFYVSVNTAQTYTIDVYRMGWYQGLGGRLMSHVGPLNGVTQPSCPLNATTGLVACNWSPSYTLTTGSAWVSGIYLALLTNAAGYQKYSIFVVRNDGRPAAFLYQEPVTTYQAYNDWPDDGRTGKSLYDYNSNGSNTIAGSPRAVKVSFDRPYTTDAFCGSCQPAAGAGHFLYWEINMVRWLEKSGYDVTYSTDVDTHETGDHLLAYRGVLSVGHDEYWSKPMYDAFNRARDNGVSLGFFGANALYWQIRFEPSASGVANRVVVCYKNATIDPVTDPSLTTVNWRDPVLNRPEQQTMGVQFTSEILNSSSYASYVVANSASWVYAGTGFSNGTTVPGFVGYETDRQFSSYPSPIAVSGTYTLLSSSPYTSDSGATDHQNSSIYEAPSGAWVFAAGTIGWPWALDNYGNHNAADSRIQQATANILDRFAAAAPAPDFSLIASPAGQSVTPGDPAGYTVNINPVAGFTDPVSLSVTGLPSGATASFSPNPATSSSAMSVVTSASTPSGTYSLTITGTSGSLTHTTVVSLAVGVDFSLSASPLSQTVTQGQATSYGLAVSRAGGFSSQVTLSATGLPSGAAATFSPNPATSSSTMSVTTAPSTPAGSYSLTITGSSGALIRTTTVTLVVAADFSLAASPSSQTVKRGQSTNYTVTINGGPGFADQVALSVSALPTGMTASFSTNPTRSSSTLSVTASSSAKPGNSTLTITGASAGGLTHTATVTLQTKK